MGAGSSPENIYSETSVRYAKVLVADKLAFKINGTYLRAYDWVANGRFKGGHITRHYAGPGNGIEAVQMETSQRAYMDEASFDWDEAAAARVQPLLRGLLEATLG